MGRADIRDGGCSSSYHTEVYCMGSAPRGALRGGGCSSGVSMTRALASVLGAAQGVPGRFSLGKLLAFSHLVLGSFCHAVR